MSADLFATNAIINEARNEVASRSRIMEWLILETHQVCAVLCVVYQNVSTHMHLKQKRGPLSMTNKEQSKTSVMGICTLTGLILPKLLQGG